MSKNLIVNLKNVTKKYSETEALKDINLSIEEGEFVYIIGESGAGKSSLLKLLYKEENVTSGDIQVLQKDLSKLKSNKVHNLRRNIGCVFQDFKLLPNLTIYENIAFVLRVIDTPKKEIKTKVMDVLEKMKIADKYNNYPDELSGGQQQRVAIARAIVNNPKMIICDEPTGNLDPTTGDEIFNELLHINEMGTTVIMTTHNKELVNTYPKRVVVLSDGQLIDDKEVGNYEMLTDNGGTSEINTPTTELEEGVTK